MPGYLLLSNISDRIYDCYTNIEKENDQNKIETNNLNSFLCTKSINNKLNKDNYNFYKTIIVPAYFPLAFDKIYLSYYLNKKVLTKVKIY
jgi:hypothetical protein